MYIWKWLITSINYDGIIFVHCDTNISVGLKTIRREIKLKEIRREKKHWKIWKEHEAIQ